MIEKVRRLAELLLKARDIENKEEIINSCVFYYSNPDEFMEKHELNAWFRNYILETIICSEFYDIYIKSDKIDEFCGWLLDAIDEPEMPENDLDLNVPEYYQWMYQKLMDQTPPLALVEVGYNDSDNIQLLIVYQSDTAEIKQLCEALEIKHGKLESTGLVC
jgi:hypothetical protein